jgi:hypothetical protein
VGQKQKCNRGLAHPQSCRATLANPTAVACVCVQRALALDASTTSSDDRTRTATAQRTGLGDRRHDAPQ